MFRCENGPCIDGRYRCNGISDCPFDNSDELDCQNNCKSIIPFRTVHKTTKQKKNLIKNYDFVANSNGLTSITSNLLVEYGVKQQQFANSQFRSKFYQFFLSLNLAKNLFSEYLIPIFNISLFLQHQLQLHRHQLIRMSAINHQTD